jgi:hypothetical protein
MDDESVREMDLLTAVTRLLFDQFMEDVHDCGKTWQLSLADRTFSIPKDIRTVLVPQPAGNAAVQVEQESARESAPVQPEPVLPGPEPAESAPLHQDPEVLTFQAEPVPQAAPEAPLVDFIQESAPAQAPWEAPAPQEEPEPEPEFSPEVPQDLGADIMGLPSSAFLYETYVIEASHNKNGVPVGEPTTIRVCIAPLEGVQPDVGNVPIAVYAYAHGTVVQASSLDSKTVGRNVVIIHVDDFELMCRGGFSGTEFSAAVFTIGASSNAGDTLNEVSCEKGGNPVSGPGHLRKHIGDTVVHVIPVSHPDGECQAEYMVISENPEFTDYYYHTADMPERRVIMWMDGVRTEAVGAWSGDFFEAELLQ